MLKERSLSAQETESPKYIYIPLRQYSEDGDNSPKNEIDKKPDIQIEPKIEKEIIIYSPNKEISEKSNGAITEYINSIIEPVKQKFSPNGAEFVSKKPTVVEPEYQYIPLRTYSEDKENLLNAANGKSYQESVEHHLKNGVEKKTVSEQIDDILQEANQVVGHDKVSNLDSSKFESNDSRNKREVSFNEDKKESVCDEKISVNNFTKKDIEESKLNKVADTIKSDPQEKENSLNLNELHKGDIQEELLKENQSEKTNIEEKNNVTKNKAKVEVETEESASSNEISKNEENLIQENGGGKEIKHPKDDLNENNVNVAIKESKKMESKQSTDKSSFLEVSQVQELQNNSKLTENCLKNAPKTEIIKDVFESDANLIHHNMEPQITSKEKAEKDQGEKLNTDQSVKKENKLSESDLKLNNQDIKSTSETCKSNLETGELSTDDTLDNIALDSLESESFPINTTQDEITKMGKEPLLQDSGMKDGVIQGSQDLNEGDVKKTELQNSNYDDDLSKKFKSMHDVDDVVHLSNAEKATEVDTKSQKEGEELKMEKNEVIKNDKLIHDVVSAAENLKNDVQLSNGEKVTEMESQKDGELELGKIEKTPAQDSNDGESSKSDKSIHDVVSSSGNVNNEVVQLSNTEKAVEVDIKSQKGDEMKLEKNEKTPAQDSNDGESSKSDKSIHDVASSSGNVNNDIIKLSNTEKVAEMKSQKDGELELGKNEKTPAQDSNDGKSVKSNKSTHDVDSSTENLNNDVVQLSNIEKAAEVDIKSQKGDELKLEKKEKTPAQDLNDGESSRSNKSTHDVISTTDNINNDVIQSSNTEKATEVETKSQKGNELKFGKNEETPAQDLNVGESSKDNKSTHDVDSSTENVNKDVIQSSNTEKATEVETKSQKGNELKLGKNEETPAQDSNDGKSSRSDKSTHDELSSTENVNNDVIELSNTEKATEVDTKSQKEDELKLEKNEKTPAQDSNDGELSRSNKSTHDVISTTDNINYDIIQSSNIEKAAEVDAKSHKGEEVKLEKNEETPAQDSNDKLNDDLVSSTKNEKHNTKLCNIEKAGQINDETQKDDLKLEKVEMIPCESSDNRNESPKNDEPIHDILSLKKHDTKLSNVEKTQQEELYSEKIELPNQNESTHHLTTTDIISTQDRKGDDELSKKKGVNETEQDTNTDEIDGGNKNKKNESNDGILNNDKPEHLKKEDKTSEKINASKVDVAEEAQELTKEINGKSKINETEENKSKSDGENRIAVTPNNKSHDIQLQNDNTQKIEYIELRKDIESNDTENKNKSDKKDETNSIKANQSSDSNLNINTEGLEKINVKIEGKDKILKSTLQDPLTLKENQNIKENQINTKNASLNADSKSESNIRNRKEITTKQPSTLESVSEDADIGENELKSSNNNSESSMDHGTTNLYMSTFKAPTFPISNGNITDNYKIYKLEHLGFGEDVEGRKSISPTEVNCSTSRSLPSLPEEDTQPDDVIKETDSVSESKSEPFYLHRQGDSPKLIASSDQEKAFSKAFQKANGIKYDSVPIRGNLGSSGSSTEELNCESNIDSRHNKPSSPHPSVQCNISVVDGSSPTSALPLALEMSQSAAGAAFVTGTTLSGAQAQNCASARDQADIDQNEHQQRAESVVVMDTVKRNNSSIIKKTPEQQAATKIQASFRGYQVRKKLKNKTISPKSNGIKRICRRKSSGRMDPNKNSNKKPTDLEQQSATKIQAGVRGFLVRRRQKKNKSVPESP
nr:uncharacterized protein YFR016C-like [Onthophagus taurus]